MTTQVCSKCRVALVAGENIAQSQIDKGYCVCRECRNERLREYRHNNHDRVIEHQREYLHRIGKYQPMGKNRDCSSFLGIHVAERVLSHVFKHIQRMPNNTPGYDFVCSGGYKIDVKSSCRHQYEDRVDQWMFRIKKNQIAEAFLCLAFDDRESLVPEYIWLIPSNEINHLVNATIAETTLSKWDKYKLPIDRVSTCCNIMKGE